MTTLPLSLEKIAEIETLVRLTGNNTTAEQVRAVYSECLVSLSRPGEMLAVRNNDILAFKLEEHRALRKEIDFYIAEFRSQERYAVIAVGAIWSWLLTRQHPSERDLFLWATPILLMVGILVRSFAMSEHIQVISGYIKSIENSFHVEGWEQTSHSGAMGLANTTLTWLLLALTVAAFIFGWYVIGHP